MICSILPFFIKSVFLSSAPPLRLVFRSLPPVPRKRHGRRVSEVRLWIT